MNAELAPARLLARATRSAGTALGIAPAAAPVLLPPAASMRRYARVAGVDGVTRIAMLAPPPPETPDEVGGTVVTRLVDDPFVPVQQWLQDAGVPVPRIWAIDEHERVMWLDDLGDVDLFACVQEPGEQRMARYREAIRTLALLRNAPHPPAHVTGRVFDRDLLAWELEHYVEWRLVEDLKVTLTPADRQVLDEVFAWIVEQIEAMPRVTMHRDYQSRNLMWHDGRLVVIDFQDAMQGPLVYDLVALLRDSYVALSLEELDALVATFAETVPDIPPATLARYVSIQTVQRKLKDAGRFVQIDRVRGNPGFLQWIPNSLQYVDAALDRVPELAALAETLRRLDPGIRTP